MRDVTELTPPKSTEGSPLASGGVTWRHRGGSGGTFTEPLQDWLIGLFLVRALQTQVNHSTQGLIHVPQKLKIQKYKKKKHAQPPETIRKIPYTYLEQNWPILAVYSLELTRGSLRHFTAVSPFQPRLPAICLPLALVVIAAWRTVLSGYGSITATRELDGFGQIERFHLEDDLRILVYSCPVDIGNIPRADFLAFHPVAHADLVEQTKAADRMGRSGINTYRCTGYCAAQHEDSDACRGM
ncbi:hypothetical protein B0H14DRAFT_2575562 [Mycena olivaceomarginata]|nr:hypothetical protein B0H14DRAFT_2575562 [Mycena olivaceomarginata]